MVINRWPIYLGLLAGQVVMQDSLAARTDRASQENAQTRARVKEEYFQIQRELRQFLGAEVEKRVLLDEKRGQRGILQAEVRSTLPLELRLDSSLAKRGLEEIFLYVDGIYWGSFQIHEISQSRENVFWYFNNVKFVPIGSRQLKITARFSQSYSPSFLSDPFSRDLYLEGVQSVFVTDGLKALTLNLALKSNFLKKVSWIEIDSIEELE